MNNIFLVLGFMDVIKGGKKGSLKYYEKKLHEFQEQEAEVLIDMGVIHLENDDIHNALKCFKDALDHYFKVDYPEGEAYAYDLIGDSYLILRNGDMALKNYEKSFETYSLMGSSLSDEMEEKIEEVKKIIGSTDFISCDLDEEQEKELLEMDYFDETTLAEFCQSSKVDESKSDSIEMETVLKKLDECLELIENFDDYRIYNDSRSIEYLNEALYTAKAIEDFKGQGTLNLIIGNNYLHDNDIPNSLNHFNNANKSFRQYKNFIGESISLLFMGVVFFVLNEKEQMYDVFKNSLNIIRENGYKKEEEIALNIIEMLST
jgi:tetratricopeptide (TPR) repeat protein